MTIAGDELHPEAITSGWLANLYEHASGGWLTLFAIDRVTGARSTEWHRVDDLDGLTDKAHALATTCCVWFGVATRAERLVGKRGGAEHCVEVPALWVDLDVAGDVHAQTNLPPTLDAAMLILDRFPLEPTAVIDSGHGLQAWWFLDEPAAADDVADMLDRWRVTWDRVSGSYHVDNVFDLPRIMRVPGTWNRKTDPRLVEVLSVDYSRRYGLGEIVDLLDEVPLPEPRALPPTKWTGNEGLPGQVFNNTVTAHQVLTRLGFIEHHRDSDGTHYTRPGKDLRDGSSVTVYDEDGHATVWSDTVASQWPGVEVRRPYDAFGLYAAMNHGADFHAAASELEREGFGTLAPSEIDLESLLAPTVEVVEDAPPALMQIRWVDTYLTDPPPIEDPVIEGLLNAGEFMVIGAERGIGKTWLGYNIASVLTTGGSLFGRLNVPKRRRVLYMQGELDETQAASRWRMLHDIDPFGLSDKVLPHVAESFDSVRFRVVRRRVSSKMPGQTMSDEYLDAVIDPEFERTIKEHGVDVVVIDPWAVFFSGNESSNDEVEAVLSKLREIAQRLGVSFIIFAHFGKSREFAEPEDLWRGASRLADWAANRVTITRHYSDKKVKQLGLERREARRFADLHFLRRGAPLDDFSMHLEPNGWWVHWEPEEDEETTGTETCADEIVSALRKCDAPVSGAEVCRLVLARREGNQPSKKDVEGMSSNTFAKHIDVLQRLGTVRKVGVKWQLTDLDAELV